ncbi:MAG: hypothetical protein HUJ76_04845 [Parasporobacterium sp.]|nr:hypothetical protein [Holdemanella sp.]MCF0229003.1 hypothetical protein [Parasporobacterium sp.]
MRNKVYIIVDKKSVKPLLIWLFSGSDLIVISAGFLAVFYGSKLFVSEIYGLMMALCVAACIGLLLIEMPDHLSILQHLQMWYRYMNSEKTYYYIPKSEIERIDIIPADNEDEEWIRFREEVERNGGIV